MLLLLLQPVPVRAAVHALSHQNPSTDQQRAASQTRNETETATAAIAVVVVAADDERIEVAGVGP